MSTIVFHRRLSKQTFSRVRSHAMAAARRWAATYMSVARSIIPPKASPKSSSSQPI